MGHEIALTRLRRRRIETDGAAEGAAPREAARIDPLASVRSRAAGTATRSELIRVGVLGAATALAIGYLTARNPQAGPAHLAVLMRVLIIVALVGTGVYAQTSATQARMGQLLAAAGLLCSVWLLNGSSDRVLFSIGVLFTGLVPVLFSGLMLAHPTGRISSTSERQLLMLTGGGLMVLWTLMVVTTSGLPLSEPLVRCSGDCPQELFFIGSASGVEPLLAAGVTVCWMALAVGTPLLLLRRARSAAPALRRALAPMIAIGLLSVVLLAGYRVADGAALKLASALGTTYAMLAIAIPVAIFAGLIRERLFMGEALERFVNELANGSAVDPGILMADTLADPSLHIAYDRQADGDGSTVEPDPRDGEGRGVTWLARDHATPTAIVYDPALTDQEPFVHAAGAAALMQLERTRLQAELAVSIAELAGSRKRLVESAHAERRRIERDLHDGVQQQLVGLRIKLEMATDALRDEPARGEQMLEDVGRQIDDVLEAVRSLARGIYPSLLHEHGVVEALRSVARRMPIPVSVRRSAAVGRYREDVEIAVYFSCLEALQNVVKHGGPETTATVRIWEEHDLCFEVSDSGHGFDVRTAPRGSGLINMRDRAEAVGGRLAVTSRRGHGTVVSGRVPIA